MSRLQSLDERAVGDKILRPGAEPVHPGDDDVRSCGTIAVLPVGSDQQLPRAIVDIHHGVGGVSEQVQDDLLELDPIAGDGREIVGELRLKNDVVSLKVTQRQRDDLARDLVQIQRLERELLLAEHSVFRDGWRTMKMPHEDLLTVMRVLSAIR